MTPKQVQLQIFTQANFIKVFYKMTTCPRQPLLNGPQSDCLILVWLYIHFTFFMGKTNNKIFKNNAKYPILRPFSPKFGQKCIFLKNPTLSIFSILVPLLHAKYQKKLMNQFWEKPLTNKQRDKWMDKLKQVKLQDLSKETCRSN